MGDEYSFDQSAFSIPMETRVLVADGNGGWQNEEPSDHYQTDAEATLSDTINDSYMTADEGGDNSTQYFSVLEAGSETILNDMSQISLDVTRVGSDFGVNLEENTEVQEEAESPEVVLFRVDGSEELYGIQVAQDEEGNFQKYQFQVRQNANGQLETVPETIQIVPFNNDDVLPLKYTDDNNCDEALEIPDQHEEPDNELFVKQEFVDEDTIDNVIDRNFTDEVADEEEEEHELEIDSKEGILRSALEEDQNFIDNHLEVQIEQEGFLQTEEEPEEEEEETEKNNGGLVAFQQIFFNEEHEEVEEADCNYIDEENKHHENSVEVLSLEEDNSQMEDTKVEMYFTEHHDEESLASQPSEYMNEGDSDNENDSEDCLDGLHISGEDDLQFLIESDRRYIKSKILEIGSPLDQITDTTLKSTNRILKNNNRPSCTLLLKNMEKENMAMRTNTLKKVNPRSVLKTSVMELEEKPEHEYDKRFAKGKVAVQARQYHNYISQTKILEAPVRQERLPRKQTIKPLVRSGEEIVVQEVVVSSNGYIETREDGVLRERKPLIATECIHLSDSDDSSSGRRKRKRVKKNKQIEIIISDSEEEENDDDEPVLLAIKRVDHKCTKCPKSFPSEGSLRTHMQYHNYSEVIAINSDHVIKQTSKDNLQTIGKYVCKECNWSFKNNILLNKHMSLHTKSVKFDCSLCKKVFSDRLQLLRHKRSHVKAQMFTNSMVPETSPKKSKLPVTMGNSLKCKHCDRVFASAVLLSSHMKSHKRFVCVTCGASFISKFVYDNHVLRSCVKSPARRKPSPRKSYLRSPRKIPRLSTAQPVADPFVPPRTPVIKVTCDSCDMVFHTHTNLLKHKVQVHNLSTPDKSIGCEQARKLHYKKRGEHGGIPMKKSMANTCAALRSKLNK